MKSATLSGPMPPTARNGMCESGERIALTYPGPSAPAGNIFTKLAPASYASTASEGVIAPGIATSPRRTHSRISPVLTFGVIMYSPPASSHIASCSHVRTVPAPTRISPPKRPRIARIAVAVSFHVSGDFWLKVTSTRRMPPLAYASASRRQTSGANPRIMAIMRPCRTDDSISATILMSRIILPRYTSHKYPTAE